MNKHVREVKAALGRYRRDGHDEEVGEDRDDLTLKVRLLEAVDPTDAEVDSLMEELMDEPYLDQASSRAMVAGLRDRALASASRRGDDLELVDEAGSEQLRASIEMTTEREEDH